MGLLLWLWRQTEGAGICAHLDHSRPGCERARACASLAAWSPGASPSSHASSRTRIVGRRPRARRRCRVAVADQAVRLSLGAVLGYVREEAGAGAILNVHRGPGGEEPQRNIWRKTSVLGQKRTILVPIGLAVVAVAVWISCNLVGRPDVVRVHVFALARRPLAIALRGAIVPLHTEHEAPPLQLRLAQPSLWICSIVSTWRSGADVLRFWSTPWSVADPDGHMNVERGARLILLPMPGVHDVADRSLAGEEVGLELRPAMVVLASCLDRASRVEATLRGGVHIGPAILVCGERDEELWDAIFARHRHESDERFVPVALGSHSRLSHTSREGFCSSHVGGRLRVGLSAMLHGASHVASRWRTSVVCGIEIRLRLWALLV
eukprot:7378442-Prymnesium_polylepis.2